jgi:hypothetical protein
MRSSFHSFTHSLSPATAGCLPQRLRRQLLPGSLFTGMHAPNYTTSAYAHGVLLLALSLCLLTHLVLLMLCCMSAFTRLTAAQFQEAAAARLTLLEGKVKFLENQLHSNKQQLQQSGPAGRAGLDAGGSSSSRSHTSAAAGVAAAATTAMAVRSSGFHQQHLAARWDKDIAHHVKGHCYFASYAACSHVHAAPHTSPAQC